MFRGGKETVVSALGQNWTVARLTFSILAEFFDWMKVRVGDSLPASRTSSQSSAKRRRTN